MLPERQNDIQRRTGGSRRPAPQSALIWRTAEGEIMAIESMETKHLFNCVKMCFNHLAEMWGGEPVWFTKRYDDYTVRALTQAPRLAEVTLILMRELDRRYDLPDHLAEPLAQIKAQMQSKTQALPQPATEA